MILLRCYATIPDFIYEMTGVNIPLPIYSFGFFLALAILVAAYMLARELKRKEKEGLLHPMPRKVKVGQPATATELVLNGVIGFVIGFKLLAIIGDYSAFMDNPQAFILSAQGNLWGGLIGALLLGYWKYREREKERLDKPVVKQVKVFPHQMIGNITIIAAIAGVLGAKVFHNLEYWEDFAAHPIEELFSFSGLTIYGGLIVGAAAVIWYARKNKIPVLHLADAVAPALILAYGVGRLGCQVAGDGDWGIVNTAPKPDWLSFLPDWLWAYDYAYNVNNEGVRIEGCEGKFCHVLPESVFPTPIYESILATIIFLVLWGLRKRLRIPGMLICLYLMLNGIERFFIEKIRVNIPYEIFGMEITQAEILSTVFFVSGLAGFIYLLRKGERVAVEGTSEV